MFNNFSHVMRPPETHFKIASYNTRELSFEEVSLGTAGEPVYLSVALEQ